MRRWLFVLFSILVAAPSYGEMPEPLDWRQLAGCLPGITEMDGFSRESAEGDNIPEAFASVNYSKRGKGDVGEDESDYGTSITVSISDCAGAADYVDAMLEMTEMDTAVNVNGRYRGKKTLAQNESGIYGCGYTFVVGNRFLVELSSMGKTDVFVQLDKLIAAMKLGQLEAIE